MSERAHLRIRHLRRLTDRTGLLRGGPLGEPDHFAGYDTLDNGLGLRLAARLFQHGVHDDASAWASIYLQFLVQAFRGNAALSVHREPLGTWSQDVLAPHELAQIARAVAVASASGLPSAATSRADALWRNLLPDLTTIRCPRAAAHWLIAIAERPPSEQRRLESIADRLASWMVEECYYALRTSDWEWFDERWLPGDPCLPHGLWAAYSVLGEQRYARVAETTTCFLVENLFEDGLLVPVGTRGGWPRHCGKVVFDQIPADVAATVELLACACDASGREDFADHARLAHAWFTGSNVKGITMLDDTTEGVYDALTATGHATGQGARAVASFLLSAVAMRDTHVARRPVDAGAMARVP